MKVEEATSNDDEIDADQLQALHESVLQHIDRIQTRKATHFALMSWNTWCGQRNQNPPDDRFIPHFHKLCGQPLNKIDELMAIFVEEIRCRDGQEYLEDSIKGLAHGLQRYIRCYCQYYEKPTIMFMKNYLQFPTFMTALKKRCELARGKKRQAPAKGITRIQEEAFWENGVFGIDSAQALSDTVYFYTVKIFGITSAASLRFLNPEDFTFASDQYGDYVEFNKDFAAGEMEEPVSIYNYAIEIPDTGKLRHYSNPNNPRTFANILSLYMEIVNLVPRGENFGFFLSPNRGMQFKNVAIGKNMLQKKFKMIMKSAGIHGNFTNQALVQCYQPLLQQNGYKVRKNVCFTIQEHVDICRLLDAPVGEVHTAKLEVAISQHVNRNSFGLRPISSIGIKDMDLSFLPTMSETGDFPLYKGLQKIIQGNNFIKSGSHIVQGNALSKPAAAQIVQAVPHQYHLVQVSTFRKDKPKPSATTSAFEDSTDEEIGNIEDLVNIAVKQEPIDYEIDAGSDDSSFLPILDELNNTGDASKANSIPATVPNASKSLKSNDTGKRQQEAPAEKAPAAKKQKSNEVIKHTAAIEYTLTSDTAKNIFKQEINVTDDDQNSFSFSGTSKVGKTASDLDINLGDYLPDNCMIRPEDIDLKRIVLPDGGKLLFKVKYTVP